MIPSLRRRMAAVEAKSRPEVFKIHYMPNPNAEPERYAAMQAELDAARRAGERVINITWRGGMSHPAG